MSIITTDRLVLRPVRESDGAAIYHNWTSDERVAKYCRWHVHEDISDTRNLVKGYLTQGCEYRWVITLKHEQEAIGLIDIVHLMDDGKTGEIGYVLCYRYWGKGIMTEALKAVISELFGSGFTKIVAVHALPNVASGIVMKKCGMKYVGNCMRQRKFGCYEKVECCCYEINKDTCRVDKVR